MTSPAPTSPAASPHRLLQILGTWAVVILILSVIPVGVPGPELFVPSDILAHAVFYAPLAAFFAWAFPAGPRPWVWARAALAAALFGGTLEFVQALLPYRDCSGFDALADLVGAAAGAAFALVFPRLPQWSWRPLHRPSPKDT
jgi:VanZ family protein